nr:hypothetical protein [Tanacetum cinerariifolium]
VEPFKGGQPSNAKAMQAVIARKHSDFWCHNYVLDGLVDSLYNVYCKTTTAKEFWKLLKRKYKTEDADDEVIEDQRQWDVNDLQYERQDQSKKEEVKPRRSKRERIKKSFGSDFVSFMVSGNFLRMAQWKEAIKSEIGKFVRFGCATVLNVVPWETDGESVLREACPTCMKNQCTSYNGWSNVEEAKLVEELLTMVNSGLYTADNGFKSGYLQQLLVRRVNLDRMEKRGLRPRGGLIGVDIGQKSLALAISDPGYQLAYPLCVLQKDPDLMKSPYKMKVFVSRLRKTMEDNNADDLLFGYPYLRWTANPLAVHIKNTIHGLDGSGLLDDVNYAVWDETYTTKIVEKLMHPVSTGQSDKPFKDMMSAVGILQGYLDAMNRYTRIQEKETRERAIRRK